jgi:molybdopterin molybdotransferase
MIRALSGQTDVAPRFVEARLADDVKGGTRVTRFLPAIVESDWNRVTVRVVPWQGSGDLAANARANGFVVLPNGVSHFAAGESVRVLLR